MGCEKNGHDAIIKHATTEKEISQKKKNMLHHEPTIYTSGLRDVLFSFWKIPMFTRIYIYIFLFFFLSIHGGCSIIRFGRAHYTSEFV